MTDHHLTDRERELLIAALYGELPPEEMKSFRRLIAEDEDLRAEWEDLQASRAFLQAAEASDPLPAWEPIAPRSAWIDRMHAWWRRPAFAFALTTASLAVLLFAGLRVDRTADGLLIHFQTTPSETAQIDPSAVPIMEARLETPAANQNNLDRPVTQAELAACAYDIFQVTRAMITEQERNQRGEMIHMISNLYDELDTRQTRNQAETRENLEKIWMGLGGTQWLYKKQNRTPESEAPEVVPVNETRPAVEGNR